ncbi:MAG: response regulator [Oligoflexus sp.]|nr:response regulator [Pseudopedobacter sp.]
MVTVFDKKIFLVDDDSFLTASLQQILNNIGYKNIEIYPSGKRCMKYIKNEPEIVFLDYQMDDMDGIEVLERIKSYSADIQVVFTTSMESVVLAIKSIKLGASDFLLKKDISEKEVESIINNITHENFAKLLD